ncbi:MAG: sodium:calcium antiporter, partial [Fimbriimonadaceae bacterium]
QRDLAVGNVVGSNIMNILLVLGVSGLVAGSAGIAVQPVALSYTIPLALAVSAACVPIFFTGHRIDRWEGGFFLFFYAAFLAYAVLNVTDSDWLPTYEQAMAFIVIPLAVLTIIATLSNYTLKRKRAKES